MLSPEVVLSVRYRLDERVATGGMGDVWRASDLLLRRSVAVKVLLPALVSDPDFLARFRAEARILAALRHPGIVQVYDCGEDELSDGARADYLVMEFVTGQPLSKRIEALGALDVVETMSIVAQVAEALHAAHTNGIVHRDVKPSNLLVQEDGSVVLVDFGVARSTNVTSVTNANAVPGTALYMAPEQAAGRPVSGATDMYALGAVAYCCLTGSPPFNGDSPLQVAVRHLDDEPPELPHDIPEAVRALVSRALAKDPADRFSSGEAMAAAARVAVSDPPESTEPATVVPVAGVAALRDAEPGTRTDAPVVTGRKRRRGALVGAAAAILVALASLGVVLGATGEADAPAVNVPTAAPAAVPSGSAEVPVEEEQPNSGRPFRPTGSASSPLPSATPSPVSPQPSPSAAPESPEPTGSTDPQPTGGTTSSPTETTAPTPTDPQTTPMGVGEPPAGRVP